MTAAELLHLPVGGHVIHLPTGQLSTITAPATTSRNYGWRVEVRNSHATTYITPANIQDWKRGG